MNGTLYMYFPLVCFVFINIYASGVIALKPGYCDRGYLGLFCTHICPYPSYGKSCEKTCTCSKQHCNHAQGCDDPSVSSCPSGFIGSYCESKCSFPYYGHGCQQHCPCSQADCHFSAGCRQNSDAHVMYSGHPLSLSALPVTQLPTIENISTSFSVTTIENETQRTEASLVQDNDNPNQRSKTTSFNTEKRTATGKSSGLLSFSKNIGTKASIVALCILFILLVIAHILLSLVQRIKENSDIILV